MSLSVADMLAKRKAPSNLLKGSDLPKSMRQVSIKVTDVREAPESFGSPIIIDFEPALFEKTAFPVNKTNLKRLGELTGDNLDSLKGATIILEKLLQNNPKDNKLVFGLTVVKVKGFKAPAKKR